MTKFVALGLGLMLLAGCAKQVEVTPAPQAPTAEQLDAMRENYRRVSPTAKIGVVSAVAEDVKFAMVVNIPTEGLKVGDIISFVDGTETAIAHGEIVEILENRVAVKYQAGARTPVVGDAAVRF